MKRIPLRAVLAWLLGVCLCVALPAPARAGDDSAGGDDAPADWSLHFQATGIYQGYPAFHSPYQGPNSLSGGTQLRETLSATAFLGYRLPWSGGALYFDPELTQGFGVSHGEGVEGFPNGEAEKGGAATPVPNVARLFLRQIIGLGGPQEKIADDENALATMADIDRVTVTAGKFAANDMFDDNPYSHDPRSQFLNLSLSESAAWDYPADQKGYTDGLAVEFNQRRWALRGGWFLEPEANGRDLDPRFLKRYGAVLELETRHALWGEPGTLRTLVFVNRTPQGDYDDALALAAAEGAIPSTAAVRRDHWKIGAALNLAQAITDTLGAFLRLSWNDGRSEGWAFTDIDRGLAAGLSLKGAAWRRPQDTVGLGGALNGLSKPARNYFAAGGLGILAGDGRLNYAAEGGAEVYYAIGLARWVALTFDYQFVADPAFNQDRGPVSIFASRLHLAF